MLDALKMFLPDKEAVRTRLMKSAYFFVALLLHLVVFIMVATVVVFKAPDLQIDNVLFVASKSVPPPPPTPPPPSGGEARNDSEPSVTFTPPPAAPVVISTINQDTFKIQASTLQAPNLPASIHKASGSEMTGHDAEGPSSGAGSVFGSPDNEGKDELQGYLYDLKQTPDRQSTNMEPGIYHIKIREFIQADWDPALLNKYYKCPRPLNTSSIFVPTIHSEDGPKAFGVENEVKPNMYVVWYKVTASPPQEGTYHFVGLADDIMLVRVNHKTVLDACDRPVIDELRAQEKTYPTTNFTPTWEGDSLAWVGLPFTVAAGDSVDIDILIGEEPGGRSNYFLFIQREESSYQCQSNGAPLLPIFQLDSQPIIPKGEPLSFPPFSRNLEPWQAASQ